MRAVVWIRRLALIGAILCLFVVVLGGYTRLSHSGLGCPDWPGCFGKIVPTVNAEHYATPLDVRKAWVERIHRYFAMTLGLLCVVIAAFAIYARRERGVNVWLTVGLVVLVVIQGMLGMLTVTMLLKPLIVTAHLLGGLATFALLLWLWLSMQARARQVDGHTVIAGNVLVESGGRARVLATLAGIALFLQIFLGGWTSSNYAAVACPICRAARRSGFRKPITRMPSCCRVASGSTMPAACWIIRRVWPFISRIASARWWPRCC